MIDYQQISGNEMTGRIYVGRARNNHFLNPGELIICHRPAVITTVLGSCVAVCLYDVRMGIGGMNHFMLPKSGDPLKKTLKFGDVAMKAIIDKFIAKTGGIKNMVAKVYGGSDTFNSTYQIGMKNIELAIGFLKERNIEIADADVGGNLSRKIKFDTQNGDIDVNYLS